MRPSWYPDWRGETVVIVASGPSALTVSLDRARGKARFIAVNESWRLAPWSEILYGADYKFWEMNNGCPEFQGLRVSIDRRASEQPEWLVHRVQGHRSDNRMLDDPGHIGGNNSGLNALNLAAQFGPRAILLVGFDVRLEYGLHWHPNHPAPMKNPLPGKVESWRRAVDNAAPTFAAQGITVLNCSPISTLKRYERMEFERALEATCRVPTC
jgi:hypothetical protein